MITDTSNGRPRRNAAIALERTLIALCVFISLLVLSSLPIIPGVTDYPFTGHKEPPNVAAKPQDDQKSPDDHGSSQTMSDAKPTEAAPISATDSYELSTTWNFDASPQKRHFGWTIRDAEFNPDGVFRQMMLINNQFPGPLIEVNEGDIISVNVKNEATNATSIHWHGIYQRGTPWMDGTVGISSCPIAPGRDFTYEFNVSGQAGSYFYHSHQGVQTADGLFGPLIIHSKTEKRDQQLKYDTDRVIMVSDYYYTSSNDLLMDYLQPDAENAEPVPDAALINGRGLRNCSTVPHLRCAGESEHLRLPHLNLERDKLHRLRLIHTGVFAEMQISIDQNEFAVTEVDGVDILPAFFDRVNMHPAQRYSIVLNASSTADDQFWLRVKMLSTCFAEDNPYLETETRAMVNFVSSDHSVPSSQQPTSVDWATVVDLECRDMNITQLTPAVSMRAPAIPDASLYLRSNFEIGAYRLSRGVFNSSSWRADVQSPSLSRVMDGLQTSNASFLAPGVGQESSKAVLVNRDAFDIRRELVVQSNGTQVIDLLISNFDDGSHAMHLHGYKFWVLAQGHGYPADNLTETLDLSNPLRRDTATVEAFGWLLIRFVADNPGAWAFHCHVSWHAEAGLVMQFVTRVDKLPEMQIPTANQALCDAPREQLERGMAPNDEVWYYE